MSEPEPKFEAEIVWTGNRGAGTAEYDGYDRTWSITTPGKPPIQCSNDPALGGDPGLPNPEDLLISSLAACHMLWYLHLACNAGIEVRGYRDRPVGYGQTRFESATLRPVIEVPAGTDLTLADSIHEKVHVRCFIARSVNFPIHTEAEYVEV